MRLWMHGIGVALGIAAPIAVTLTASRPDTQTQRFMSTREVITAFETLAFDEHKSDEALKYVAPDFVDHDPSIQGDRKSVAERLAHLDSSTGGSKRTIRQLIVEGDLAVVHYILIEHPGDRPSAAVDFFRVRDGHIVEHWSVLQPFPKNSPNGAAMF